MLARRVIAITPDNAFAKRLSVGLKAAGGTVESYPSLDALAKGEIQAALVVVHLDGALKDCLTPLSERLRKDAHLIAVVPKSDLLETVGAMKESDRVTCVMVADDLDGDALASMATRILYGDIFGVEKLVKWGTKVYSTLIGDYQEKSVCIAQVSEFAAAMGVRRKYREAIEQVLDEMLMNALYDAPVDSDGKMLFADVPTKTRISLRMEQKAVVQYACNGSTFTLSCRDSFGTLTRETVVKYLHKCLHSDQQIDRKTGGAGLGLYIMANTSTMFVFNVLEGVATECICTFDLSAPKVQLKQIGFFTEKIDPSGRLVGGASKLIPSGASFPVERRDSPPAAQSKLVVGGLAGAIVLLLALIALVAYPRFTKTPTTSIRVMTTPKANIEVDGHARGNTDNGPLLIDKLKVGQAYTIRASQNGYYPVSKLAKAGKSETTMSLKLLPRQAVVNIETTPAEATVTYNGQTLGTTPTKTQSSTGLRLDSLPPGKKVTLSFKKRGYVTATTTLSVPQPGGTSQVVMALVRDSAWGSVTIKSKPSGATVYHNRLPLEDNTPLKERLVRAGRTHLFKIVKPGFRPEFVTVPIARGGDKVPINVQLKPGGELTVTADGLDKATVTVERRGKEVCSGPPPLENCGLRNGRYVAKIESEYPRFSKQKRVRIRGNNFSWPVKLGFVRMKRNHRLSRVRSRKLPLAIRKFALEEGRYTMWVAKVDKAGKIIKWMRQAFRVKAGNTLDLPFAQ